MGLAIGTTPPWRSHDPRSLQRQRWVALARSKAEAARLSDLPHVARAFELVALTVAEDHAVDLPTTGQVDLRKSSGPLFDQAIALGQRGLGAKEVALRLGLATSTAYGWLVRAGVIQPRRRVRIEGATPSPVGSA